MSYKFGIHGKRTNEIPEADCLSRLPVDSETDDVSTEVEVNFLFEEADWVIDRAKIVEETRKDSELRELKTELNRVLASTPKSLRVV